MDLSYIGEKIRKRRKDLGLTQLQIRKSTGISTGNMSEIENGNSLPSCTALIALSKVLQCSVDYLLETEYSKSDNSYLSNKDNALSEIEESLLDSFKELTESEKQDVLDYVQFKEFKSSRRSKRDADGTERLSSSDHDYNSSNSCGIA